MEWDAIYCCERLAPGYIGKLGKKTAGNIGTDLDHKARKRPQIWQHLEKPAAEFSRLVVVRNQLMHGTPGSLSPDAKGQLLFRAGMPWIIDQVNDAADEFTACQILLNDVLHNVLR
jgi:hypothetical protein